MNNPYCVVIICIIIYYVLDEKCTSSFVSYTLATTVGLVFSPNSLLGSILNFSTDLVVPVYN